MLHSFRKSTNIFFSNDNLIIFLLAKLKFYLTTEDTEAHRIFKNIFCVTLCPLW